MTKYIYTINKRDLTAEEQETANHFYKGLRVLRDTLTEERIGSDGYSHKTTYYIFVGNHVPYGACVKRNGRYVFARYSRWDSVDVDFTDFALDCAEDGSDNTCFETKHIAVNNNVVEI